MYRCIKRQAIVKFQTTRDNEKTLITFRGWGWGGANRTSRIGMVSAFSNKATLDTRKTWRKPSKFGEKMIF